MYLTRTKNFGGRTYRLRWVLRGDRSDANEKARELRSEGMLVRVLHRCIERRWHGRSEWGYAIYICNREKS